MSLPALYAVPDSQSSLNAWAFNHAANHYDWLITPQTAILNLSQFSLNPIDANNTGMWLYQHQVMHNEINAFLKTTGFDLTSLDWEDPEQFRSWINQNAAEHVRISAALGVQ